MSQQEQIIQTIEKQPTITPEVKDETMPVSEDQVKDETTVVNAPSSENSEMISKEEQKVEVNSGEVKIDEVNSESEGNKKRKREESETESKIEESPEKKVKNSNCSQEYHSQSMETTIIVASSQEINC
jgi:hypothetical protein